MLVEWQLWMHPEPTVYGPEKQIVGTLNLDKPSGKAWKKGKLQSKMPLGLRRCVADVARKHGGDTSKAFAICTASLQKAGVLKKGTHKLSKKGRLRTSKKYGQEADITAKDIEYEKLFKKEEMEEARSRIPGISLIKSSWIKNSFLPKNRYAVIKKRKFSKSKKGTQRKVTERLNRLSALLQTIKE